MADPDDFDEHDIREALRHASAHRPIPWEFVDGLLDDLLALRVDPHVPPVNIFERDRHPGGRWPAMARLTDPDHSCAECTNPDGSPLTPEDCTPIPGKCNRERWPLIDRENYEGPKHFVGLCRRDPTRGADMCQKHGASVPRVRAAAARRLEQQAAEAAVITYGLPLEITPTEALIAEVQWSAGHVAWLREKVRQIDGGDALVWGRTEHRNKTGGEDHGTTDVEQAKPSIWLELYLRERKHMVEVCATALKAGVEERRVKLAEQQGDLVAGVIRSILDDLALTPEQEAKVAESAPRHLRAVAGGAT